MSPTFDENPPVLMDTGLIFFDTGSAAAGGARKGTMIQLALKLTKATLAALKTLASSIKSGLTGNASFPTPNPTPANIQTAIDEMEAQENALALAESKVEEEREMLAQKRLALENILRAVAANCMDTVKLDPEDVARAKLMSAMLPLRADNAPVDEIESPDNFFVTQGDHSGEADGGCDRVKNAKLYRVRFGTNVNGPFQTVYEGTKSSFTAKSLPIGEGWFQMAAFGTNGGWSEWSDPARCHVI